MKPDNALLSIFYILGYIHGSRYILAELNRQKNVDRDSEKYWIDFLPPEVSALRSGGDPEPAVEKTKAG